METQAPGLQRPKRASKRPPLADDFIDNIDIEIEAIESLLPTTVRPAMAAPHPEADGPRKRGRPRKYPLAPPPLPDVQPVKRPRGSGKHQRAAAGSIGGTHLTGASTGGVPAESGVTSAAISAAPSVTVLPSVAPPTARGLEGRKNVLGTPAFSFTADIPAKTTVVANGHATPNFPPQDGRHSDSDDSPSSYLPTEVKNEALPAVAGPRGVENTPKITAVTRNGRAERAAERQHSDNAAQEAANGPADGSLASADAVAFTPRPRNRRKGAVPTKTE